jgi:hypothetical protein
LVSVFTQRLDQPLCPRQSGLVYQLCILSKPLQAGEVHVHCEEAGVAGHAVHRALVAMPYVGAGRAEGLCGSTASEAGAAPAGGWARGRRARICGGHEAYPFVVRASGSYGDSAGAISLSDIPIIVIYLSFDYMFYITFLGVDVRQKTGGLTCKSW